MYWAFKIIKANINVKFFALHARHLFLYELYMFESRFPLSWEGRAVLVINSKKLKQVREKLNHFDVISGLTGNLL